MRNYYNIIVAYSIMMLLIILVGIFQSWSIALQYLLLYDSAVMTMGANILLLDLSTLELWVINTVYSVPSQRLGP